MTAPRLPSFPRPQAFFGLVLAYAVALQFVLAALVASQHAAAAASGDPDPFAICSPSAEPAGDAVPSGDALACCVLCMVAAAAPADAPRAAEAAAAYRAPHVLRGEPFTLSAKHRHDPRSSQGPPASA